MTAATLRPGSFPPPPAPALPRRARADRRLLGLAFAVAALVHLLTLLVPLPERADLPLPPAAAAEPPRLVQAPLPPPERADVEPPHEPPPIEYRTPIPWHAAADVEPLVERRSPPAVAEFEAPEIAWLEPVPPPAEDTVVFDEGRAGLLLPVPWDRRAEPRYPRPAREARLGGRVVLSAVIDETGRVVSIEVVQVSRPDVGFTDAAIEAVASWRYEPGRYGGRPVPVRMRVVVEFSID